MNSIVKIMPGLKIWSYFQSCPHFCVLYSSLSLQVILGVLRNLLICKGDRQFAVSGYLAVFCMSALKALRADLG